MAKILSAAIFMGLLTCPLNGRCQEKFFLTDKIAQFEQSDNVRFFYKYAWVKDVIIEGNADISLTDFISKVLPANGFDCLVYQERYFILSPRDTSKQVYTPSDTSSLFRYDGKVYTVYGYVREANSGEVIPGAMISVNGTNKGTTTNASGFYSIKLLSKSYNISVNAIGRTLDQKSVQVTRDERIDFNLFEQVTELRSVEVSSEGLNHSISSMEMSVARLDMETLKKMPTLLGEPDLIKSMTLMPGVKTVGDGAGGFNVRGGSVDQNLVLLDNVPVFNTSHLFGFFSTFNTDAIKDATLLKGGIPAQYGGRASSVLDVRLKRGNEKDTELKGSLGIISGKLFLEGPIVKNKTSFLAGVRYAYPDWMLNKAPDLDIQRSAATFYDITAKVSQRINESNNLSVSTYISTDQFRLASDTVYGWTTKNIALNWNSLIGTGVYLDLTAFQSWYEYSIEGEKDPVRFTTDFGIKTTGGITNLSFPMGENHHLTAGVSTHVYEFNPGQLRTPYNSAINPVNLPVESVVEGAIYLSNEFKLDQFITLNAGLRFSAFYNFGNRQVYRYAEGVPKTKSAIIDTLHFSSREINQHYSGLEPRLSMNISLNETTSIKASYNRNLQYIHLLSNTTAMSPLDIWKASDRHISPQLAQQYAVGFFKNFNRKNIETTVELYYKETENTLEYKDGANMFLNTLTETVVLPALGKAYGVELMLKKNAGKLTGWIGYTYSRTLRIVEELPTRETINAGDYFPSNYDKPHDLSIVTNYRFSRRISASANFVYNTGRPITLPEDVYVMDGYALVQFSKRNQGRIPDYHRLDLSLTLSESLKKTKSIKGSWTFSVFNAYGRRNPYSIFFKPQYKGAQPQSYRLAVLGTVFPSLTYNFKVQ